MPLCRTFPLPPAGSAQALSTHLCRSERPTGTGQKSVVCPSPGRWDRAAPPLAADAVVRMSSSATGSGSRHNSQVYYFLLDQGGAEDIAGQPDLGRNQMPYPGAPPSRPIHHCPSPTKQHRLQTGGGGGSTVHHWGWERLQTFIWKWDPNTHAVSLKEGQDTEARPQYMPRGQSLKAQILWGAASEHTQQPKAQSAS